METFVADLSRLYRLAAVSSVEEFPKQAVAQLQDWIGFDGAVFGFGEAGTNALTIGGSVIYNRAPAIVQDYAAVSGDDPTTRQFIQTPGTIMNVDTSQAYASKHHARVAKFTKQHDIRHLLLLGEQSRAREHLRWMVLYRGTKREFQAHEAARLSAAWGHVLCALELNQARTLDLHAHPGSERAVALVNRDGTIEIADPAFLALLRTEWRDLCATRLPLPVLQALPQLRTYSGHKIEIRFFQKGDFVLCQAHSVCAGARLSPREAQVAHYFSTGHSYKAIAALLGSSPNTVRAQLATIYQKLGINDKAMLASALARLHPH